MKSRQEGISIKLVGILFSIVIGGISIVLFGSLFMQFNKFNDVQTSTANYMAWKDTALEVSRASDYLTD